MLRLETEGEGVPPFHLASREVGPGVVVVEISGELDGVTAPRARRFLASATADVPAHLVVDLSRVTFLPSRGVQLLLAAHHNHDGIHGALHLVGVQDNRQVRRVLDLTGLADSLDLHPDLPRLLDELDGPGAA